MKNHSIIWENGYNAFMNGASIDICPYRHNSIQYDQWCEGWNAAAADFEDREPGS